MAQELLRDAWLHAQPGRLSAWGQAKTLALREVSRELHGRTQLAWIAARVEKAGGGHPSLAALHQLFASSSIETRNGFQASKVAQHVERHHS